MAIDFSNFTSGIFIFAIFVIALAVLIYLFIKIWKIVIRKLKGLDIVIKLLAIFGTCIITLALTIIYFSCFMLIIKILGPKGM
jgi:hypothetical protein